MSDQRVVVGGGDPHANGRSRRPGRPPRSRAGLIGLVVVLGALSLVAPDPQTPTSPPSVVPPPRPTRVAPPDDGADAPEIARGWQRLDLPGDGPVVSVSHGSSGWMALSAAEISTVSLSTDARVWVTRTFPGPLDDLTLGMVAGDRLVVAGSDDTGPRSWISSDGGETWETALFPPGGSVETLGSSGTRILAGGASTATGTDTPIVWEYTNGEWTAFQPPAPVTGEVQTVTPGDEGVFAFGRLEGEPAGWRVDTSGLRPLDLTLPIEITRGSFAKVARMGAGTWLAAVETDETVAYLRSPDLEVWSLVDSGLDRTAGDFATSDVGLVQMVDDRSFRVVGTSTVTEIRYRYPRTATGFEQTARPAVVASDGERIVMGGGVSTPALWIRGLTGGAVGVVARPTPTTMRWATTHTFGDRLGDGTPDLLQVVRSSDDLLIATPDAVWRVPETLAEPPTVDAVVSSKLIPTETDVYLLDETWELYRDGGGAGWVGVDPGFAVRGLTQTPSGLLAYGRNERGEPVLAIGDRDGPWSPLPPDTESSIVPVAASGGSLLGFETEPRHLTTARVTTDGATWLTKDIAGIGGLSSGIPFLITARGARSTSIELLGEGLVLEVPSIDPVEAIRVGRTVRVRGSDGLWETTDRGATWQFYPIGIELRMTGTIRLVPTEHPTLLAAGRDSYRLLSLTP